MQKLLSTFDQKIDPPAAQTKAQGASAAAETGAQKVSSVSVVPPTESKDIFNVRSPDEVQKQLQMITREDI